MMKILFICHGRKRTQTLKCWYFLIKMLIVRWIYRGFTENQKIDKKSSAKKLKNRLIISHNLYILWVEVNVCRLLMVRGISDSVRKLCHLLYRWGILIISKMNFLIWCRINTWWAIKKMEIIAHISMQYRIKRIKPFIGWSP